MHILVVDDEKNIVNMIVLTLMESGHEVKSAFSVKEALTLVAVNNFDLILTDYRMDELTGLDLIREVKKTSCDTIIIVMTAYASFANAIEVTKEGAFDYLPKPFSNSQLKHLMKKAEEYISIRNENTLLRQERDCMEFFNGLTSPSMAKLQSFVEKIAPTNETILVTGENGTGKSELAKLIHAKSLRAQFPFITVYCTTVAESIIESELFGHVKGAFTGAFQNKQGKFELADGGTLFLDEIGELSMNAQTKLLRFLQDRMIERVGGVEEISVDARIIAATNKNLRELVSAGKFREDLYFRLNILECRVPSLSERKEDISVLANRFIRLTASRLGKNELPVIDPAIMNKLVNYNWPGNVRELKNSIDRMLILAQGSQISISDLPECIASPCGTENNIPYSPEPEIKSLEECEREMIIRTLKAEKNLERAAAILGITPVTLWRKRKQYGFE